MGRTPPHRIVKRPMYGKAKIDLLLARLIAASRRPGQVDLEQRIQEVCQARVRDGYRLIQRECFLTRSRADQP